MRDDRLWRREVQRACLFNAKHVHCMCTKCMGQRRHLLRTVGEHLIQNGRDTRLRVWRGLGNWDSSDKEWEEEFWRPAAHNQAQMDAQVDMEGIIRDAFQDTDVTTSVEEQIREEVLSAFMVGDVVHEEYNADSVKSDLPTYEDGMDDQDEETHSSKGSEELNFDGGALEEAITALYEGAQCAK
jgi:hypothetical protein